jgi:hypothetical protein
MRHTHWRTPKSLLVLLGISLTAATFVPVRASQPDPRPQEFDPRSDQGDARPRDLAALQDDLYLLDGSLRAFPRSHPQYEDFQRRTTDLKNEATVLANRMSRDRRYADRRYDERYGADYRFVPARASEVTGLRYRVTRLREEIDDARGRRFANRELVIPAGTTIEVMLDTGLSSRWANVDDRFEASTVSALPSGGRPLIPAGALITGSVREVRSRHRGQGEGFLRLDFDTLTLQGGSDMDLSTHVVTISKSRSGERVRNGALGGVLGGVIGGLIDGGKGAVIGAAVGVGGGLLASRGREVDLPEGTVIALRLDRPLSVPRRDLLAYRQR